LKGAAVNAAGEVTASSLHDYVDSNMGSAKQRPLFFGEMTGRIVLMHFPKKAKSIPPQKPEAFLSKFIPRRTRQPLEVGVVLGSESLAIGLPDGTILEESALTATEASTNRIVAVGNEAKKLLQQLSSDFIAVRPVKDGAVADYRSAEALLRGCLHNVIKGLPFRVVAAIPSGSTEVEKDALKRALYSTGAFEVDLVETSILAAIGAGLPVQESRGFAVLHCSEDLTEIALIALSGIVYSRTIHIGTNEFDEAIVQYLRQAHSLSVGGRTAQNIRLNIGTAFPLEKQREMIANGRDSVTGMLKSVSITSNQILEAILEPVSTILYYLNEVIIRCPLELSADLAERGLVIAGVGALLPGIDECLALETGLPVRLAPNPLTAVLDGTRLAHDRLPALRQK
jgi:rod shape-determining protein MreB